MADIWFISDTHFSHEGSLAWDVGGRGSKFASIQEMDEFMIHRWNEVIRPEDKVYHLGDVFFGAKERFNLLWARLMGKKRLIPGNHDNLKFLCGKNPVNDQHYFQKVDLWRIMKEHGLLMTHVPVHESTLHEGRRFEGRRMINVHGHIHTHPAPKGPYHCVCVEQTDYRPVHLDELKAIHRKLQ